jgi:hypothetical protein
VKLKCNHARRAMVLPSGNTIHRDDGSRCYGDGTMPVKSPLTIGGLKVTKLYAPDDGRFVTLGSERETPETRLLREIFTKKERA